MSHRPLAWLAAAALAIGCAESTAPDRPLAPTVGPRSTLLATPSQLPALAAVAAAADDARTRIVPTLPSGEARTALDAALGALSLSLVAGEVSAAGDAVARAESALRAVAADPEVAPADAGAVALVLDRATGALATSPLAMTAAPTADAVRP